MNWEVVKITNEQKGSTMPYASVGFGRLTLSAAACDLLKDFNNFSFVELMRGRIDGKLCIGIRFLKDYQRTSNSLPIKRRKTKEGTYIKGADIANKAIMEELFGINGTQQKATRYDVRIDKDAENVLIVLGQE